MKKTLVAKCAAALIGTAMATGASAAVVGPAPAVPGVTGAAGSADSLAINTDGIGHILFVPYYSVQNGNDTYLNIVNTDTLNGKAVKVRFRGAANSDDVFDFTILMSPGDVWAAAVTRGADGRAKLVTNDKSCTLPAVVSGASFPTARLKSSLTDEQKAEQTREGYIEILNMADIPVAGAGSLYAAIKHTSAGVPANCAATAITSETLLKAHATSYADANTKGLFVPTTGLTANWTIINVAKSAAWTGAATAVEARIASTGAAAYGNVVFSPQNDIAGVADPSLYTSDPLLRTGAIAAVNFDFPDMSTPYVNFQLNAGGTAPINTDAPLSQAEGLTSALAVTSVANEYVTDVGVNAKTDWTFSMPTRRYNVARNYAGAGSNVFTTWLVNDYFTAANTTVETAYPNTICVTGISTAGGAAGLDGATTADREERFVANATEYVISPGTQAAPLTFCGEVSVLSFNAAGQTSALGGVITRKDLTLPYADGWVRIATPGLGGIGLPLVGASFVQFTNNAAQAGTVGTYGMTYPHRSTR